MQIFRQAILSDAEAIAALVNSAYRGDSSRAGWTTEADILDGLRTDPNEIRRCIEDTDKVILLCVDNEELVGAICLEKLNQVAQLGMFVVNPLKQANGIGRRLLAEAEKLAQQIWVVDRFQMLVITLRHELIAFYERRGYVKTGIVKAFPINPAVWQPKLAGLQLEILEKKIR